MIPFLYQTHPLKNENHCELVAFDFYIPLGVVARSYEYETHTALPQSEGNA